MANWSSSAGGLRQCDGVVERNIIRLNGAAGPGGGLSECHGLIEGNDITQNSADAGGGLHNCMGTVRQNTIIGNRAACFGGGLAWCWGAIRNNVIAENVAGSDGGALMSCAGPIENNTIVANSADMEGGGLELCRGSIVNCVIWANSAPEGPELSDSSIPSYSCIRGWTGDGEGNIGHYPHFMDEAAGDYGLRTWSPCIDAGDPLFPFLEEPEPNGARINMGAYGNTSKAASKSPNLDGDTLPDDWEVEFFGDLRYSDHDDPDGDSLSNINEYYSGLNPNSKDTDSDGLTDEKEILAGTNPRDAGSVFAISEVLLTESGAVVKWSAVQGKRYQVYTSLDLESWQPKGPLLAASGSAIFLSVLDPDALRLEDVFYKVEVLQ